MPNEKIKFALKKLHTDLSEIIQGSSVSADALCTEEQAPQTDKELQELLTTVADDIAMYLEGSNVVETSKHGLAHRLEEIATDFSIEHPKVDTVLKEVRKILLSIGA